MLCRTCVWQVKIKKGEKSSIFFYIFLDYYPLFYVFRGRKTQNNQKKLFFNYFLLYLVATIVIIALYTKNNILIFRYRIYRVCLEIVSQFWLVWRSFEIFFIKNSFYEYCFQHVHRVQSSFSDCIRIRIPLILCLN